MDIGLLIHQAVKVSRKIIYKYYLKKNVFFYLHNSPIVIDFNKINSIKSIRNVTLWYVMTYVIFIILVIIMKYKLNYYQS